MYIDGQWCETDEKLDVVNPADGQVVYRVSMGGKEQVDSAIAAAQRAFGTWSQTTAMARADLLLTIAGLLMEKKKLFAQTITNEMGKPLRDALGEVQMSIDYFRWFAEEARRVDGQVVPAGTADKRIFVIKQPIGVVGAILPWNFPLGMLARKVAPALAVGCTMVVKPASQTPQTALEFCRVLEEAGLSAGVFNLVVAPAQVVADAFAASPEVRKITFTGSTEIGKKLMADAAGTVKRVSMELGGHAPYIVMDDADIDLAAEGILNAKFRCSGQMCTAANRVYVQRGIADAYVEKVRALTMDLKVGDGRDEATVVGPLVSKSALQKVAAHVEDARQKGAAVLCGGVPLVDGEYANGNFYAPTVLAGVTPDMSVYTEETFGPVVPIIFFETEEELAQVMNHAQFGLASYFYTNDLSRMWRIAEKLEYGMVGVNDPQPFGVQCPFGGVKESGFGREGGHQGIDDYVVTKMISMRFKK